jgi:ribose-phosphate pyrophosphokinase
MYKIHSYPDGGKYAETLNSHTKPLKYLVYHINSYEDLFLLKSLKDSNPKLSTILIPCLFQQQHDRRFSPNQSFELKLVCDFINSCNFDEVHLYHPHSDVAPALINNCVVIDNTFFIQNVLLSIHDTKHTVNGTVQNTHFKEKVWEYLTLMSSDAGGFKPLMKLCNEIKWKGETFSASKARDRENLIQVIDRQDFNGKDILIIDDICVYGGTFIGLAQMLRERNAGKLYLAVSHLTVQEPNPQLFNLFETVFTTASKNISYKTPVNNLKILPGWTRF